MESGNIESSTTKKLIVVGITGIFGSGKTTVGKVFQEEGVPYFSLDAIVHQILKREDVKKSLQLIFGDKIINNQEVDKKTIAKTIFSNTTKKKEHEELIHPLVFAEFNKIIFDFRNKGGIIVFEIPLLFETKSESFFSKIIVVSSPLDKIYSRLKEKFSPEDIKSRLANQIPLKQKEKNASYIIFNSGSLYETTAQVKKIIKDLQKELHKSSLF
ncbi:dephospho-CoA kinase [bacterium]|nr:dephospho-CoA kinase [bacterium]